MSVRRGPKDLDIRDLFVSCSKVQSKGVKGFVTCERRLCLSFVSVFLLESLQSSMVQLSNRWTDFQSTSRI